MYAAVIHRYGFNGHIMHLKWLHSGWTGALVVLLATAACTAPGVAAKRSRECPGGCIIASVVSPVRQCACVVPDCNAGAGAAQAAAAAFAQAAAAVGGAGDVAASTANAGGTLPWPLRLQPPRMEAVDCGFCDRDAGTYSR